NQYKPTSVKTTEGEDLGQEVYRAYFPMGKVKDSVKGIRYAFAQPLILKRIENRVLFSVPNQSE
ncbi:hypothetical protein TNCV_1056531, partial [Trichonephila clavipes]